MLLFAAQILIFAIKYGGMACIAIREDTKWATDANANNVWTVECRVGVVLVYMLHMWDEMLLFKR